MYCNKCAVKVNEEDEYCFNCGNKLKQESIVKEVEVDVNNSKRVTVFDVFAILGFIFSIISLVLSIFLGIVDILGIDYALNDLFIISANLSLNVDINLPVLEIVFSSIGLKSKNHKGKAVAGIILSILSLLVCIAVVIINII